MLPSEMVLSTRLHVGDTSITAAKQRFTDTQYLRFLDEAMDEIAAEIVFVEPTRLETSATLSLVSGTELYNLPGRCHQIRSVVRTDGTTEYPLDPLERAQDRTDYLSSGTNAREKYYFSGNQIGIVPIPSESGNVTVKFIRFPTPMMYGTIFSATGVTIMFPAVPTAGTLSNIVGVYVGAKLQLTSGTGQGTIAEGVSYVQATRVLTTNGLSGVSWQGYTYELLCGLDEAFHRSMILFAAAYAYRGEESMGNHNSFLASAIDALNKALRISRRQVQELGRMRYVRRNS